MPKVGRPSATGAPSPPSPDTPKFGLLDFLQSPDQSFAAAENEPFHLSLDFLSFHGWLGHAILGAMAEFADNKFARDRRMQSGLAPFRGTNALTSDRAAVLIPQLFYGQSDVAVPARQSPFGHQIALLATNEFGRNEPGWIGRRPSASSNTSSVIFGSRFTFADVQSRALTSSMSEFWQVSSLEIITAG